MSENKDQTENLSSKVVKGSSWLLLFQVMDNALGFFRLIILARLLTPSDFGLIGIALLVLQIISTFTQTGFHAALIHKSSVEKYVNSAWTYLVFRGFLLYILLYVLAPFLGGFFNAPDSINVIRVIGVTLIFEGLTNIGVIYFQKELSFNKQFLLQITGNLIDFVVTILLALYFKNVWAVVAGNVLNGFVRLALSYILSTYRPIFEFNLKKIRELNSYGKWIFGSSVLMFLYGQADDIFVGRILGTTALGFYQLAYRISNLPGTQITYIISTVMFPAYSKIQNDKQKIRTVYLSTLQVTAFLSFFLSVTILLFAHDFVLLFLGEQWLPIQYALQILAVWGLLRSIGATTGALWQALGTPGLTTKIQLLQTLIMALLIYPFTITWGFTGTAVSVVTASIISNTNAFTQLSKTIHTSVIDISKPIMYPFICSIIAAVAYVSLRTVVFITPDYISFFVLAIASISTYLLSSIILSKYLGYSVYKDIFSIIEKLPSFKYAEKLHMIKKLVT